LVYFNVVVKSWRGEIVLGIYSRAIKVVAIKKAYNISVALSLAFCKGNWGTRLQKNPQLILQFVIMIQLTSRRILRD